MKVLILEDNEVYAQVLSRSLQYKGYETVVSHEPSGFLKLAEIEQPDYIILDLFLDSDSSLPLIKPLRALLSDSKIVVLTGYASISTTVQAIKLGADDYIPKPATTENIIKTLTGSGSDTLEAEALSVERLEWEHIQRILEEQDGNISATARLLGMHRRTLQRKLSKKPPRV